MVTRSTGVSAIEARQATARAIIENLCARICHDFSGPIGTLMGALECITDQPGDNIDEAVALARDAAVAMVARLRLLRAAWSGPDGDLTPNEILALLAGLNGRTRLDIDLSGLPPAPLPAADAQVLLNLLMLAAEALPAGGRIAAGKATNGDRDMMIDIAGPRGAWPPDLAACLNNPDRAIALLSTERRSQAALTALISGVSHVNLLFMTSLPGTPASVLVSTIVPNEM